MESNAAQIQAIQARTLEDESFIREMVAAKTMEQVKVVLQKNGYRLPDEEIALLMQSGKKNLDATLAEDELTEEMLEDVAGGGKVRGTLRFIASLAAGAVGGFFIGVTGGAAAPGGYLLAGALTAWTVAGYAK